MPGPLSRGVNARTVFSMMVLGMGFALLTGCDGPDQPVTTTSIATIPDQADADSKPDSTAVPSSHETQSTAGHYLAARHALFVNDVGKSADFFLQTIETEGDNVALLRQAFLTQYYYGDIEKAAAIGRQLESLNISMPLAGEPATALAIRNRDWAATLVLVDRIAEDSNALVIAGIIQSWALAASGLGDAAISTLTETGRLLVAEGDPSPAFIEISAMLMAEYLGYEDEARQRAEMLASRDLSAGLSLQLASFLSRQTDAQMVPDLIEKSLSDQFNHDLVLETLEKRKTTKPEIHELIAAAIVDGALAKSHEEARRSLSARLRLALFIDPSFAFGHLLLSEQLSTFGQYQEALGHLDALAGDGVFGQPAELSRAVIIEEQGEVDQAISILQAVVSQDVENTYLLHRLGDTYRRNGRFQESRDAYMKALALGRDSGALHRSLGVSLERLGESAAAEVHLLRALEIDPGDAYALNYLGYWWADEGRNLEEAIRLIERAVEQQPNSGFFVDSLGWVHFKLGDPAKAVSYLEKATELEPDDAEIIGHLGDVYWVLGRFDEARFKWRLALSLSDDDKERADFERRLEKGLQASDLPAAD